MAIYWLKIAFFCTQFLMPQLRVPHLNFVVMFGVRNYSDGAAVP